MAQIIFQTEDEYGNIEVKDCDDVRSLFFGSFAQQSAMSLKNPDELHLAYTKAMISSLLFNDIEDDVLLIGLGGGSLAKYLLQNFPKCRIEVVEQRKSVVEIAHHYFDLPSNDARLNIVLDDGAHYVHERENLQREFYSLIMLDVFDSQGMAQEICNLEFFTSCQKLLKKDGILIINLWNTNEQFKQLFSWLGGLFNAKLLFLPVEGVVNVNGLFFHENTPIYSRRELQRRAIKLEKTYKLPFKQFLKDLIASNPNFIDRVTSK